MYALRMLFYLARLVVFRLLGILRFLSKPGSRFIVPVFLIGVLLLLRPDLHILMRIIAWHLDRSLRPEWFVLDAVLVLVAVVLIYAYVASSRLLAVILGAFPMAKRPLPPMRRLVPTKVEIQPAVVRIAVPALPRRQP